jgi:hypothetical protein
MTIEEIAAMPGTYHLFASREWGVFWDSDQGEYTIARYSHSEVTTPIHRHWSMGKKYFHNVAKLRQMIPFFEVMLAREKRAKSEREFLPPEHSS